MVSEVALSVQVSSRWELKHGLSKKETGKVWGREYTPPAWFGLQMLNQPTNVKPGPLSTGRR
jgi:hypothetical protein